MLYFSSEKKIYYILLKSLNGDSHFHDKKGIIKNISKFVAKEFANTYIQPSGMESNINSIKWDFNNTNDHQISPELWNKITPIIKDTLLKSAEECDEKC